MGKQLRIDDRGNGLGGLGRAGETMVCRKLLRDKEKLTIVRPTTKAECEKTWRTWRTSFKALDCRALRGEGFVGGPGGPGMDLADHEIRSQGTGVRGRNSEVKRQKPNYSVRISSTSPREKDQEQRVLDTVRTKGPEN